MPLAKFRSDLQPNMVVANMDTKTTIIVKYIPLEQFKILSIYYLSLYLPPGFRGNEKE